jgi:hypothetical protein
MKFTKLIVFFAASLLAVPGCSEQTKVETKEALQETGEAIGSAAEDAKKNAARAAGAIEDKLNGDDAEPAATAPAPTQPAAPASTPGAP